MALSGLSALKNASGGSAIGRLGDLSLAVVALMVIGMMVLPLPPVMLDVLVAINIASGITLLLFALYVASPMAFSTFPSVLLFVTLFRIALNVATTRQILLHADAGDIIETFGRVVVGGSLLVGVVIFMIITVVQFIVIAKGAERVAEVGARFTLDAMPGKQIAIDSDLRAGLISQSEALRQRRSLNLESQFYGSMDGAMKFVKGDAIASIIIVVVNLLGGLSVGVLVNDMAAGDAVARYAVLSIGDGLVTQIPALFISMAAGIVVTRTADNDDEHLAAQMSRQFGAQPRSLMIAGAAIALFSLMPGFPALPFLIIGGLVAWVGFRQGKVLLEQLVAQASGQVPNAAREGDDTPGQVYRSQGAPYSLIALQFPAGANTATSLVNLNAGLGRLRERWRHELGVPYPGVGLRSNDQIDPRKIQVLIGESVTASITLDSPVDASSLAGNGCELLNHVVLEHAHRLIGVQEARWMLSRVERQFPDLVREASRICDLPAMAGVLADLVAGGVPLRDMRTVLETIVSRGTAHNAQITRASLVEYIRQACSRLLCESLVDAEGRLKVMILATETEQILAQSVLESQGPGGGAQWPIDVVERTSSAIRAALSRQEEGLRPILLVPMSLRAGLQAQLSLFVPGLRVISHAEVAPGVAPTALASISLPQAGTDNRPITPDKS